MKKTLLLVGLSVLVLMSLLLVACSQSTSTSATATTSVKTTSTTPIQTSTTKANWWDKFGKPVYGGEMVMRATSITNVVIDPAKDMGLQYGLWFERMFMNSWTVDPAVWKFDSGFVPQDYWQGMLVKTWEQTDPTTITLRLRQGVKWQNKAPTNGREFVADDVIFNYDRILGSGHGFTEPNPMLKNQIPNIDKLIAVDKYTVQVKFKNTSIFGIYDLNTDMIALSAPEALGMTDWKAAVGTGAWMISDFAAGTNITCVKNPDYWGNDERYPQNKLPYCDSAKFLCVPDKATALAALRTGKIDGMNDYNGGPTVPEAENLAKTNPEITQWWALGEGPSLNVRVDVKPFSDIRVRQALQLALDLKTIAKSHYGGVVDGSPCGVANPKDKGWVTPFAEWPADLQQEYAYDPTRAKKLLADAGYATGFKTNAIANGGSADMELLQIIKSYLNDVGIDMEIKAMDGGSVMPFLFSKKHDQMVFFQFAGRGGKPWTELSSFKTGDRLNFSIVDDPKFNALVDSLIMAPSVDQAMKISKDAEQYILKQHWTINIFAVPHCVPIQSYVKGYNGESGIGGSGGPYFARLWKTQK